MGKEEEPTSVADLGARGSRGAFVNKDARVIAFCHTCRRELYSAEENNFVTQAVAKETARSHGGWFSLYHYVSVVSGKSPKCLGLTFAVNERPRLP